MLSAEKETKQLHANVCLAYKEILILNANQNAPSIQNVLIILHVYNKNAKILVLEYVAGMLIAEFRITTHLVIVIPDILEIRIHHAGELQVRYKIF